MKKVGINLLWMVPGVVGGSETYLTRLLSGLADMPREFDYTIFALPQFAQAHPDLAQGFEVAYAPVTGQWKSFRVAGENTWLAAQCRLKKINLVHHGGGTVPFLSPSRPVLTIHDLQYLYYPEYFSRSKLAFLRKMVPRSAEAARLILTPSEFTRRTVIERLNIDPSVVVVVPHGISPRDASHSAEPIAPRYGIEGPFFLYPAATYPHKNHLVLVEAFARLLKMRDDAYLVFTGAKAWMEWRIAKNMAERIENETHKLGIADRVLQLGYIPANDLDALYREAAAMTFPSRFEGFGAPVMEAMARSCPVIAADATALPEVVEDAGVLVSPDNAEHWAQAMLEMLEGKEQRERYIEAGLQRSKAFTWEVSASILQDSYRHALATTL